MQQLGPIITHLPIFVLLGTVQFIPKADSSPSSISSPQPKLAFLSILTFLPQYLKIKRHK